MGESRLGAWWPVVKGFDCQLAKVTGSNPIMLQDLFCFPALSNGKVCVYQLLEGSYFFPIKSYYLPIPKLSRCILARFIFKNNVCQSELIITWYVNNV